MFEIEMNLIFPNVTYVQVNAMCSKKSWFIERLKSHENAILDKYKKNYNISVIILFNKKNCKTSQVCDLTCTN